MSSIVPGSFWRIRVLSIALVFGCATAHQPIPDGVYVSESGEERITIRGPDTRFQVWIEHQDRSHLVTRDYSYTVRPDGAMSPGVMTSVDAVFGVGRYDWKWDGEKILKTDPETGESVVFTRSE